MFLFDNNYAKMVHIKICHCTNIVRKILLYLLCDNFNKFTLQTLGQPTSHEQQNNNSGSRRGCSGLGQLGTRTGNTGKLLYDNNTTFEMKVKEKSWKGKRQKLVRKSVPLTQFNKSDGNRGDLPTRVENMYEILKDISSELHNIRVSIRSPIPIPKSP